MKVTYKTLIISGSTAEAYHYKENPLAYDYKMPSVKRSPILVIDKESEQRKIESRKSSMHRSRSILRRLVNANAWKWFKRKDIPYLPIFLTFTFAEDIKDIKIANSKFSKFIKRLNYEITGEKKSFLKYVVVTEFQDFSRDGVIHFHAVFFNLKYIWADRISEIWGQGFIKLKAVERVDNVGAYICKYMVKHFEDNRLDGKKRFFSSRELLKPIVIKDEIKATEIINLIPKKYVAHEKDFERKSKDKVIGKVTYTQYKLDKKESFFNIVPNLNELL